MTIGRKNASTNIYTECLACHSSTSERTIDQLFFFVFLFCFCVQTFASSSLLAIVSICGFPHISCHYSVLHHALSSFVAVVQANPMRAANVYIKLCMAFTRCRFHSQKNTANNSFLLLLVKIKSNFSLLRIFERFFCCAARY